MQNEAPDEVYIIVSGEIEIIDCEMEKEHVLGTLQSGDIFGEVGALCSRPQSFTFRTKTLSQLLRLKTNQLIETMQIKQENNVVILKNFLQHHKRLKNLSIGDLLDDGGEAEEDPNMGSNLLTVASSGNAALLDELLKAKLDPDVGDSKGRTPLHIAASKGHEECVLVLLKHSCNIYLRDINGNTALWEAIASKHHSIFKILYHCAAITDPLVAGDLLCTAAKRSDPTVMKELLKQGLHIDSKNHQGLTAVQIAFAENNVDMVYLLVMNGADVINTNTYDFSSTTLNEMLQKREIGHRISVTDPMPNEVLLRKLEEENERNLDSFNARNYPRVSIYRGHPIVRRETGCVASGRLIRLPKSLQELKNIAGEKFGFDASTAMVTNEEGAEIDSMEVIRDNDKLFIVDD